MYWRSSNLDFYVSAVEIHSDCCFEQNVILILTYTRIAKLKLQLETLTAPTTYIHFTARLGFQAAMIMDQPTTLNICVLAYCATSVYIHVA